MGCNAVDWPQVCSWWGAVVTRALCIKKCNKNVPQPPESLYDRYYIHVVSFFDLLIAISCDLLNEITSKLDEENRGIEFHNEETCSATCHGDDNKKNLSFSKFFVDTTFSN